MAGSAPSGPGRLFVGTVPEDFSADRDVALGPWCFLGREHVHPDWTAQDFARWQPGLEERRAAAAPLSLLAESLAHARMAEANGRLGRSLGWPFWRIMLLPLTILATEFVWLRYRAAALALADLHGRELVLEGAPEPSAIHAEDIGQLTRRLLAEPALDAWVWTAAFETLAPGMPHRLSMDGPAPVRAAPRPSAPVSLGQRLRSAWLKRFPAAAIPGLLLAGPVFQLLAGRCRRPVPPPPLPPSLAVAAASFPPGFPALVERVLGKIGLDSLDQGLEKRLAQADGPVRPGLRLVGPVLVYDEDTKLRLALAAEAGNGIVCSQHGGTGIRDIDLMHGAVEMRQHAYITWGWTEGVPECRRPVPLPSPYLSRFVDRHRERKAELWMVSTAESVVPFRLFGGLDPASSVQDREAKGAFFAALPPAIRAASVFRPYVPSPWMVDDVAAIRRRLPDLTIGSDLNVRQLHRRMLAARLVVTDHPATTLSLTLAAGIPTIAYWNARGYHIRPEAAAVMDGLERCGLLHRTPEGAAAKAAEIWDDVGAWWQRAETRAARREYCRLYAWADRRWWWRWARGMRALGLANEN